MGSRPAGLARFVQSVLGSVLGGVVCVAPASSAPVEVRGRVLDAQGTPARGASVEILPLRTYYDAASAAWSGEPEKAPSAARAVVGADGGFAVAAPAAGLWKLAVAHEGHVPAEYPLVPLQDAIELPELELARDVGLEVEVALPAPAPAKPAQRLWVEIVPDPATRRTGSSWRTPSRYALLSEPAADAATATLPANGSSPSVGGGAEPGAAAVANTGGPVGGAPPGETASAPLPGAGAGAGAETRAEKRAPPHAGGISPSAVHGEHAPRRVRLPRGAEEKVTVTAWSDGLAGSAVATSSRVRLALAPAAVRFVARLTQHDGQPLRRALVLAGGIGIPVAMTDDAGRASISVAAGEPILLTVLTPEGRLRFFTVRAEDPAMGEVALAMTRVEILHGTVVDDADGRPIAGAAVWSEEETTRPPRARAGDALLGDLGALATSGADGRFELPVTRNVRARAVAPGYVSTDAMPGLAAGPIGMPAPDLFGSAMVRLRRSSALGGVVVTETGEPVARALVVLTVGPGMPSPTRVTTDAAGRFRIAPVHSGRLRLAVLAESFAPLVETVEVSESGGGRSDLRFVLRRGQVARGRVADLDGRAVAGARVRLAEQSAAPGPSIVWRGPGSVGKTPPLLVATAADGSFAVDGIVPGSYDVTVDAEGYAITSVPGLAIPAAEGDVDLGTLLVGPGVSIEGLVVDADGSPLAGAAIEAQGRSSFPRIEAAAGAAPWSAWTRDDGSRAPRSVTSAEDGRFAFRDLNPAEMLDLRASLDGYAPATAPRVVGPTEEPVRIVLERAGGIAGSVIDESGEAVPNARLSMTAVDSGRVARAHVDEQGAFEDRALLPASYRVEATAQGYEAVESPPVVAVRAGEIESGVRIVLREAERGEIEGRVVDEDGAGVAAVRVSVAGARARATTGVEGEFHLDSVPVGRQQILAIAPSRRTMETLEVREGKNSVEITLESGVEVSGRVVDREGAAVAGARVSLQQRSGSALATAPGSVFLWRTGNSGTSDAEGGFVLTDVVDGTYELAGAKEGYAYTRHPGELRVTGSPIAGLELVLEEGGSIRGELRGLDFDQLSQVTIWARGEPQGGARGVVGGGAEYTVADVAAGEWHVTGDVRGHGLHAEGRVWVEEGSEARLDLDFEAGITLSGQVVRRGRPAPGAFLVLRGLDVAGGRNEVADHEGRFRFRGLEEGLYELRAQAGRDNVNVPAVELLALEEDREIQIEIGGARVTGVVYDAATGVPLRDARVFLRRTSEDEQRLFFAPQRQTGAGGEFVFDEVPGGAYLLEAGKERYANEELALEVASGADREGIVLELEPSSGLELRVASAVGPPGWIHVMVLDRSGRPVLGPARVSPSPSGTFVVEGAGEGVFEVLVASPGLATVSVAAAVPGPPVEVMLPLSARVVVEIPALLGGNGVALVETFDSSGRRFVSIAGGAYQPLQRVEHGRGHLDGFPPGRFTLRAMSSGGGVGSGVVSTVPGGQVEVRLE